MPQIGDIVAIPGGMDYEYELAMVVAHTPAEVHTVSYPNGETHEARSLATVDLLVWAPGQEWHGEKVRATPEVLDQDAPLATVEAAARLQRASLEWRDATIRTADKAGFSQRAVAARADMSQPGVRKILGRE